MLLSAEEKLGTARGGFLAPSDSPGKLPLADMGVGSSDGGVFASVEWLVTLLGAVSLTLQLLWSGVVGIIEFAFGGNFERSSREGISFCVSSLLFASSTQEEGEEAPGALETSVDAEGRCSVEQHGFSLTHSVGKN